MSNINLYSLSNKIRTNLLTTIDKEIFKNSKSNHLLINSQNQEQIIKKFQNYRDITIKYDESFEEIHNYKKNSIIFDSKYNHFDKRFSFFYQIKTNNECLLLQKQIIKSLSLEKKNGNSRIKKIKNSKISENNLCKLKINSGKTIIPKRESSFSYKNVLNYKNPLSLNNNNKKFIKKFSADVYIYSSGNKKDDSSKLINYCYKLKKPNDEIIDEISGDDTSTNKKNKKNLLLPNGIKNKNKHKKKLKKIINKKIRANKNNHSSDGNLLIPITKNNSTNFTSLMKHYFENVEKLNPKEKIKIQQNDKRLSNAELKKSDVFHWKKILHLHHCKSKSHEKKSKGKKLEQARKSFCIKVAINKKLHKNSINIENFFKSVDNTLIILKNKEKKEKIDKKNASIIVDVVINKQSLNKQYKSSRMIYKKNDEFRQNKMFCFGKKIYKRNVN